MSALAQDLPQELLGEIFEWCLPRDASDALQPNSRLPPLVLCHVCSSWREAALGTPQLWKRLSMTLEHASVRSIGGGFLRAKLHVLEFWSAHMGALLPSLHFHRENSRTFISYQDRHKLVSFDTFFRSPAISNVQSLTLSGFLDTEVLKISTLVGSSFNNLEYLSISEGFSRPLQFPACPSLRRLKIGFEFSGALTGTIIWSPWATLTHLNANLRIRRRDWYTLLAQCVNMTSCSIAISFLQDATIGLPASAFHHNLRVASVRGFPWDFNTIFRGFVFHSLIALRLSSMNKSTTLRDVHQALTAAPALKEFHLQFCVQFEITHFLRQSAQDLPLVGPLYKFAPSLVILVIDRIASSTLRSLDPSTTRDVLTLLHSSWLNNGWATLSHTKLSVEFIFDVLDPSLADDFNEEISRSEPLPFHASARYLPGGLWINQSLNAEELCHRWDEFLAFSLS